MLFFARLAAFCRRALNVALALALFLQAVFLAGLLSGFNVALSPYFEGLVKEYFLSTGLELNFGRLAFDFRGRLHIYSPKLRFLGSSSDFFEARALSAKINPRRLLSGEVEVLELGMYDGRMAPSYGVGSEGWSFENVSFRMVSEGGDYELSNAFAQWCGEGGGIRWG